MNTDALLANINLYGKKLANDRLVSELNYARRVSFAEGGAFDALLNEQLKKTLAHIEKHGYIREEHVAETERALSDMREACKKYIWGLAGHAHIDMNWLWRYDETALVVLDTFRTMLTLTDEFPSFTFSQSQASTYEIVEKYEPEMLDEIKDRIKRGQWEVTATSWVEPDRNMPNLESEIRHLLYTKRYISDLLGVPLDSLNIDYEPDTFGHNSRIPDALAAAGVKYLYHCRGTDAHGLHRFAGEGDADIIEFRELDWYNRAVDGSMAARVPEFCKKYGIDMLLTTYGVGDHGGGPTRRDINRIIEMTEWPIFPTVRFSTYSEFFASAERVKDSLPIFRGERNCMFTGCYTSQSCIKRANAQAERSLYKAEAYSALAQKSVGAKYNRSAFESAWRRVLFNHFHDILTGSGVPDTREYAMGEYQNAFAAAATSKRSALNALAGSADTSVFARESGSEKNETGFGAGAGYGADRHMSGAVSRGSGDTRIFHIFNALPWRRLTNAEIILWDYAGDASLLKFTDSAGNAVEHSVLKTDRDGYWGHRYARVLVRAELPACGYATVAAVQNPTPPVPDISDTYTFGQEERPFDMTLDNGLVRAEFDSETARIARFTDLETGETRLSDAGFDIIDEDPSRGMTSWIVGRHMRVSSAHERVIVKPGANGELRKSFTIELGTGERSKLECEISLDKGEKKLNYSVKCDWREAGTKERVPQLGFSARMPKRANGFLYASAGGFITRAGEKQDKPSQFAIGANGALLMCDSRYGFRGDADVMRVSLIRSSIDPDALPEQGVHNFNLCVSVFEGGGRELHRQTEEFLTPPDFVSGSSHAGANPAEASFLEIADGDIQLSGIKLSEDGNALVLHLCNPTREDRQTEITLLKSVKSAKLCDLLERETGECAFSGNKLNPRLKPGEVCAVRVEL